MKSVYPWSNCSKCGTAMPNLAEKMCTRCIAKEVVDEILEPFRHTLLDKSDDEEASNGRIFKTDKEQLIEERKKLDSARREIKILQAQMRVMEKALKDAHQIRIDVEKGVL